MDRNEVTKLVEDLLAKRDQERRYANTYSNITHNGLDGPILNYVPIHGAPLLIAATTNGTTAVNVFNAFGSAFNMTITGVFLVSQDTTAGNITLKEAGNTVVTIAKGTVSGTLVGGVSLANTSVRRGDSLTIVSSSAGNATVFVAFTIT